MPPGFERTAIEWGVLNLGNVEVVARSLPGLFWVALAGTAALAPVRFALGVLRTRYAAWRIAY